MRNVAMLVRLARHELEERRSDLACISGARAETETAIGTLDRTVTDEAKIALNDPTAIAAYGHWASRSARARAGLRSRFEELDLSTEGARENLRDKATQMRRLEIVVETMRASARRTSMRKADSKADERELARWTEFMSE
jgi:hypothetical protein